MPAHTKQIVFIDAALPDLSTLHAGLPQGLEAHHLDPSRNGLEQIAAILEGRHDIAALHLITHGAPGRLYLGNSTLGLHNLTVHTTVIEKIAFAMADDGEILIYGCEVAAGFEGIWFVDALQEMTGLKVAAATHKVGHAEFGGDWILDSAPMEMQASAFSVPAWQGVLVDLTSKGAISPSGGAWGTPAVDASGNLYVLFNGANTNTNKDIWVYKWNGSSFVAVGNAQPSNLTNSSPASSSDVVGSNDEAVSTFGADLQIAQDGTLYVAINTDANLDGRRVGVWKYEPGDASPSWVRIGNLAAGQPAGYTSPPTTVNSQDMEIDSAENVYSAVLGSANGSLRVGRFVTADGGTSYSWEYFGGAFADSAPYQKPDLELSSDGTKYVAYLNTSSKLVVAKFNGTSWDTLGGAPVDTDNVGAYYDLEIAPDGKPYVVYQDGGNTVANSLTAAKFDGTNWVTVGSAGFTPNSPMSGGRMVIDSTGTPYVSYNNAATLAVVTKFDGTNWVDLGQTTTIGYYAEVAVASGAIWVIGQKGWGSAPYNMWSWTVPNAVPTLTTLSTLTGGTEDTTKTIAFADLQAAGNEADSDGTVTAFEVQAVTTGTLTINGLAYNASTNKTIETGKDAVWTPAANANGTAASALSAFTVKAKDNGGAVSATAIQVKVEVEPANDAPVLADTSLALGGVAINAATPTGAVGTLVSDLVGGITDPDTSALKGVAITATNSTNGTWYYTTNGGTSWSEVGTVSATDALLLASNADTRVYFKPAADWAGSVADGLTIRAWDQNSGTAGSKVDVGTNGNATAFSTATDTVSVTVSPALTYSATTLSEATANDGSISNSITISLAGDTFTGSVGAALGTVTNTPAGLTYSLVKASDTTATLSLTGNATNHANANDVSNLTVTFANGNFTGGSAAAILGSMKNNLVVDFRDPVNTPFELDLGSKQWFRPDPGNAVSGGDASYGLFDSVTPQTATEYNYAYSKFSPTVTGTYDFKLTSTALQDSMIFLYGSDFDVVNKVPTGTFIIGDDDSGDEFGFNNNTTQGLWSGLNDVALTAGQTYYFVMSSFTAGDTGAVTFTVTGAGELDITGGTFTKQLSYSATTFTEAAANDGSISASITITLIGDTFTGSNGGSLGTVANVPAGLTASLVRASDSTATLTLTGNASAHANANDIANLTVTFANGDFTGNNAAAIVGRVTNNLAIDFADPPTSSGDSGPSTPSITTTTVDGATVTTGTTTTSDGRAVAVVTIAPVSADRTESTGGTATADVPLFFGNTSATIPATTASLPTGVGLTSTGARTPTTNAEALENLIQLVKDTAGTEEAEKNKMTGGGEKFLVALDKQAEKGPLIINSVKLTVAPGVTTAPGLPITIQGTTEKVSGASGSPVEAIVIDTRELPTGTVLDLQNVEFAVIVGSNVVVRGGKGSNIVYAGSDSQDIMLGEDDDELHAGDGDDKVGSADGNDLLFGDAGNDTVFGGAGDDTLLGGMGDDSINGDEGNNTVSYADAEAAVKVKLKITGKAQDTKGAGHDTLENVQNVTGSAFNDKLKGSTGDNVLSGGEGTDVLKGGKGADSFLYLTTTEGGDKITGFSSGVDTIAFKGTAFGNLAAGTLDASLFVVGSAAQTEGQRFVFDVEKHALYFDADGSGTGTAVLIATIGSASLTAGDIVIV